MLQSLSNQINCPERHLAQDKVAGNGDLPQMDGTAQKRAGKGATSDAIVDRDMRKQEAVEESRPPAKNFIEVE